MIAWNPPRALIQSLCLVITLSACSDSFGPRWVDRVTIDPDSAHLEVGESAVFVAIARDQNGNPLESDWPQFIDWNEAGGSVFRFETTDDGRLSLTALREGGGSVSGRLGRANPRFQVWVRPPGLDRIELSSTPVASAYQNSSLSVLLFDTAGVPMNPGRFRISWAVADTSLATAFFPFRDVETVSIRGSGQASDASPREGTTTLSLVVNGIRTTFDLQVTAQPLGPIESPGVTAIDPTTIEVVWTRNSQASRGYRVTRARDPSGPFSEVRSPTGGSFASFDTTWVDRGLEPSGTYFYQVQSCNQWGCALSPSPLGSATTPSPSGNRSLEGGRR